jgi:hypothetical protein
MELDLWLGDRMVARAQERDRGRKLGIAYEPDVVAAVGDEIPFLSCSLPTPGPSTPANARAFLEGLLPEDRALETMAASVRGVRALSVIYPHTRSERIRTATSECPLPVHNRSFSWRDLGMPGTNLSREHHQRIFSNQPFAGRRARPTKRWSCDWRKLSG